MQTVPNRFPSQHTYQTKIEPASLLSIGQQFVATQAKGCVHHADADCRSVFACFDGMLCIAVVCRTPCCLAFALVCWGCLDIHSHTCVGKCECPSDCCDCPALHVQKFGHHHLHTHLHAAASSSDSRSTTSRVDNLAGLFRVSTLVSFGFS